MMYMKNKNITKKTGIIKTYTGKPGIWLIYLKTWSQPFKNFFEKYHLSEIPSAVVEEKACPFTDGQILDPK